LNIELTDRQKVKVRTDRDLYPIMREILLRESHIDKNKEHFWICGLAANNRLLYVELVSLGTLNQSILEPMDVFAWALQKQVAMIIMVHNHPTEKLVPTAADKDLTDRMIQVGRIVNIKVVDHLIITTEDYYSFETHGLMRTLSLSKKYVPGYLEVERIKKEAERIGEERGVKIGEERGRKEGLIEGKKEGAKDKAIEIAKELKQEGIAIKIIEKSTGLTKEEIERL
jgi:DNA repair protein RadC